MDKPAPGLNRRFANEEEMQEYLFGDEIAEELKKNIENAKEREAKIAASGIEEFKCKVMEKLPAIRN